MPPDSHNQTPTSVTEVASCNTGKENKRRKSNFPGCFHLSETWTLAGVLGISSVPPSPRSFSGHHSARLRSDLPAARGSCAAAAHWAACSNVMFPARRLPIGRSALGRCPSGLFRGNNADRIRSTSGRMRSRHPMGSRAAASCARRAGCLLADTRRPSNLQEQVTSRVRHGWSRDQPCLTREVTSSCS